MIMKLWIARDKTGLWIYNSKPKLHEAFNEFGCPMGENYGELPPSWFPEVIFENSPQGVELKLVK